MSRACLSCSCEARPGRVRCAICLESCRLASQRHRFAKAPGVCLSCSRPARPGRSRCGRHLRIARERADARRLELFLDELCSQCGLPSPTWRCQICRDAHAERGRQRRAREKVAREEGRKTP